MQYEELLSMVGDAGFYQWSVFAIINSLGLFSSMKTFSMTFFSDVNDHWCSLDGYRNLFRFLNLNVSLSDIKELAIPHISDPGQHFNIRDVHYKSCYWFPPTNNSDIINNFSTNQSLMSLRSTGNNGEAVECMGSFEFAKSPFYLTIPQEWDLVCDRKWYISLNRSLYMVGYLVGLLVFGTFADRFGRRKGVLIGLLGMFISDAIIYFSPNFAIFTAARFVLGMCNIGLGTVAVCLQCEMIGEHWRIGLLTLTGFGWTFGMMIMTFLAYYIRNWRMLQLVTSVPELIYVIFFFIVPESPRWLYVHGRRREAEKVMRHVAKWNRRKLPAELPEVTFEKDEDANTHLKPFALLSRPNMRKKSLILFLVWFGTSLIYYGISMNTSKLPGDRYVNFFISALVEIPASFATWFFATKMGRKSSTVLGFAICSILMILSAVLPKNVDWVTTSLIMGGKAFGAFLFGFAYFYTMELMPTVIRSTGLSTCSVFARFAGISEPFLAMLGARTLVAFFAFICIMASILTLFLPETRGKTLPDTLEEGEMFGKTTKKEVRFSRINGVASIQELDDDINAPLVTSMEEEEDQEGVIADAELEEDAWTLGNKDVA